MKKHISSLTMEGYFLLSAKLSQAKEEKEDYKEFSPALHLVMLVTQFDQHMV
ncbi:DUF3600 domain-containing protein [Cytobacillus firmus]